MSGDVRDLRTMPEPFATADLADEVVNQRASILVAIGNHGQRIGRSGVSVWMDGAMTSGEVGGSVGPWPEASSYRGQSYGGLRLSDDERRYIAACLYAAALNLIEHRNESEGEPA